MFCLGRYEQTRKDDYSKLVVAIADRYIGSRPPEDVDTWPMSFGHAISAQVAAHRFSGSARYRKQAEVFARMAMDIFWQDKPLPRASMKTGHYEAITGGDSLALAVLEVAMLDTDFKVPSNTIDR